MFDGDVIVVHTRSSRVDALEARTVATVEIRGIHACARAAVPTIEPAIGRVILYIAEPCQISNATATGGTANRIRRRKHKMLSVWCKI